MADPADFGPADARRFYDRVGARQDSQAFYENPAVDALLALGGFSAAHSVLELGCGTGKLAERLLTDELPSEARYVGVDLSPVMVKLATRRLSRFGPRARILEVTGDLPLPFEASSFDRFISAYVFDLLPETSLPATVHEAARVLQPGGLLCSVSITHGSGFPSRQIMKLWEKIWNLNPRLLGGCRPIEVTTYLENVTWELTHRETVHPWGIASEILIARRR